MKLERLALWIAAVSTASACAMEGAVEGATEEIVVGSALRIGPAAERSLDPPRGPLSLHVACTPVMCLVAWNEQTGPRYDDLATLVARIRVADQTVLDPIGRRIDDASPTYLEARDGAFLLITSLGGYRIEASDGAALEIEPVEGLAGIGAAASDGSGFFSVRYREEQNEGFPVTGATIYGRLRSETGALVGPEEFEIASVSGLATSAIPGGVAWNGSSYLVAWTKVTFNLAIQIQGEVRGSRVDAQGNLLDGAGFSILDDCYVNALASHGGRFGMVCQHIEGGAPGSLQALVLDDRGRPMSDPVELAPANECCGNEDSEVVFDGSVFVATWRTDFPGDGQSVQVGRFSLDGVGIDDGPIVIEDDGGAPEIAAIGDGLSLLVYQHWDGDGQPWHLAARILETTPAEVPDDGPTIPPPLPPSCSAHGDARSVPGVVLLVLAAIVFASRRRGARHLSR